MEDGLGFLRVKEGLRVGRHDWEKGRPFGRCNFGDCDLGIRGAQRLIKICVVSSDSVLMVFSRFYNITLSWGGWEKTVEPGSGFDGGIVLDFRMAFCTTNCVKSFFTELDEVNFSGTKTGCGES